eukprot:3022530-Rhodomonas_salina.1
MAVKEDHGAAAIQPLDTLLTDLEGLNAIVGSGGKIVAYPPSSPTAVQAARYCCKQILQYLLQRLGTDIFTVEDKSGNTVLTMALFYGQKVVVDWVLEKAKEDKANREFWRNVLQHRNKLDSKEGVLEVLQAGENMWNRETKVHREWNTADLNPYATLKYYTVKTPPPWGDMRRDLTAALN